MKLWIVGKWRSGETEHSVWDFQGVFRFGEELSAGPGGTWLGRQLFRPDVARVTVEWEDGFYPIERKLGDDDENGVARFD